MQTTKQPIGGTKCHLSIILVVNDCHTVLSQAKLAKTEVYILRCPMVTPRYYLGDTSVNAVQKYLVIPSYVYRVTAVSLQYHRGITSISLRYQMQRLYMLVVSSPNMCYIDIDNYNRLPVIYRRLAVTPLDLTSINIRCQKLLSVSIALSMRLAFEQ